MCVCYIGWGECGRSFFIVRGSTHSLLLNDQHGLDSDNVGSASSHTNSFFKSAIVSSLAFKSLLCNFVIANF